MEMDNFLLLLLAIVAGSAISLASGALLFLTTKKRHRAVALALPFGAGALLAAAFFDLLPESIEHGEPSALLGWTLIGFLAFFLLERLSTWFHHHHEHTADQRREQQNRLVIAGDLLHNVIDGAAIGAAFLANPVTGFITTLAVSAHEIPKELGTFGILLSRGWKDKKVIIANIATAFGTLVSASLVFWLGHYIQLPEPEMLAITAGFFIYIAASDIIPEIHEQPRRLGTAQAAVLVVAVLLVAGIITLLGTLDLH